MAIDGELITFGLFSLIAIGGALGCVYAKRVAHSMLSLVSVSLQLLEYLF